MRSAVPDDLSACKCIGDQHRAELGFLSKAVFADAAQKGQLLVADEDGVGVRGFVRFNHRRRGTETALYDIGVAADCQKRGIGKGLILALVARSHEARRTAIVLKCPEGLPANAFYERVGFRHAGSEPGRKRALNVWRLGLGTG